MPPEHIRLSGSALPGLQPMQAESIRSFPRHTHDLYGIGVIDRGGQRSASGRGAVEALRGDVIMVNPGEVHDGAALQGVPRAWRMVYLEPALWWAQAPGCELTHPVVRDPALRQRFDWLFAAATQGEEALALEAGLLELLRHVPSTAVHERSLRRIPASLERARDRLADDYLHAPSLAELAQEAELSRYQLLRGFSAAFGLPPHAWLQQCRVAHARRLVAQGLGLAETAAACGFADQSHMTRAFVRFLGFTPGAYAAARRA